MARHRETAVDSAPRKRAPWRRWLVRLNEGLNHDFCPWANRYVYWLKKPIGWMLIAAIASLILAIHLAPQAWAIFGALVAVVALGMIWPSIAIRSAVCQIRFDQHRVSEGDLIGVQLTVTNKWPWPLWGLTVERGFLETSSESDDAEEMPAYALARVGGWSCSQFRWQFRPPKRGLYPHTTPLLITGFPFGIWQARRAISIDGGDLIAWPRTVRLSMPLPAGGHHFSVTGVRHDRSGSEGEFLGLRPFRNGDSLRQIHWVQTARQDALIVCERQSVSRTRVTVEIDVAPQHHFGTGSDSSIEWAIRIGATLCRELHAHHYDVDCVIAGHRHHVRPGRRSLHVLFDALARHSIQSTEPQRSPAVSPDPGQRRVVIATDPGLNSGDLESVGDSTQLLVVLKNSASAGRSEWTVPSSRETKRIEIHLDSNSDVFGQLRRQWEKTCHDQWSKTA